MQIITLQASLCLQLSAIFIFQDFCRGSEDSLSLLWFGASQGVSVAQVTGCPRDAAGRAARLGGGRQGRKGLLRGAPPPGLMSWSGACPLLRAGVREESCVRPRSTARSGRGRVCRPV